MPILPPVPSHYVQLVRTVPPVLSHMLSGTPMRVSELSAKLFDGLDPVPRLLGLDAIPETPFVLVCNHYESPRAAAWWGAVLMSGAVASRRAHEPCEVHWVMASEWAYTGWAHYIKQPVTQAVFARAAQVFGFVRVPPVLDGEPNRGAGVAGVRQALSLTRGLNAQLIGIAPEGHTGPQGALKAPPQGAGTFLLLLTHNTIPCLPVGWWEESDGQITIRFGAPFQLDLPRSKDRGASDRAAATRVMVEIGRLLPERLWGAYRQEIGAG